MRIGVSPGSAAEQSSPNAQAGNRHWCREKRLPLAAGMILVLVGLHAVFLICKAIASSTCSSSAGHSISSFVVWTVLEAADHDFAKGRAEVVVGKVQKHPQNPLLVQDKPWDMRWDNGYPNIEYDPDAQDGINRFQLWHAGFIAGKDFDTSSGKERVPALLYANSSDGLNWQKPALGIFDLSKVKLASPGAVAAGTRNNVLSSPSDGVGVFKDVRDSNSSRRYKALGWACFGPEGNTDCITGTAVSADGLHWTDAVNVTWDWPAVWNDHQNIFFDEALHRYVLTTRVRLFGERRGTRGRGAGRAVGISLGPTDGSFGHWTQPKLTFQGTAEQELYSQVTWRFHNIYLGIVMVYDIEADRVHCRLAWSHSLLEGWQWVSSPGGLTGPDLIPLEAGSFDSDICFAAHLPIVVAGKTWLYYMGGNGPHYGARSTALGLATLRVDGFAGLRIGSEEVTMSTVPLRVEGPVLSITCDIIAQGGFVQLGIQGGGPVSAARSVPIESNVTDGMILFRGGETLASLLGQPVSMQLIMKNVIVYTFAFRSDPSTCAAQ